MVTSPIQARLKLFAKKHHDALVTALHVLNNIILIGLAAAAIGWAVKTYALDEQSIRLSQLSNEIANNGTYWGYNLARMEARMSVVALCLDHPTYAPDACKIVLSWELLPSIVEALNPARDNPSGTPPLVQDGVQRELLRASSLGGIVLISSLVLGSMIVAVHALAYLGRDSTPPRTQAGGIALATM